MEHVLTVADVVAVETLGLIVHAGRAALTNPVEGAHVTDFPNAPELLEGGEFLMTAGSLVDNTPESWETYVAGIAASGAAAFALGVGPGAAHEFLPAALVAAAERHGVPLIEIPAQTPFLAVSKAIMAARAELDRRVLERSVDLQRDLTRVVARERGLTGLIQAWHQATGENAVVLDRRGRPLATSPGVPVETTRQVAEAAAALHPMTAETARVRTDSHDILVCVVGATRHAGYLARIGSRPEFADLAAPTLLALLALEFERRWLLDEPQRRARANQLTRLLGTDDAQRASAQLKALGIQSHTVQAIVIEAVTETQAEEVLADLTIALGTGLVRRRERLVEAVATSDPTQVLAAFHLAMAAGIGTPVVAALAARSMRQAHSALGTSRRTGSIVTYVEGKSHEFLLAIADPDYLATFADAILGPIEQAENGAALVETLHAWLAEERSIAACAERLAVHRHTVRNRMQRVTQLLGRSVETVETQTELWLALKARGVRDDPAARQEPSPPGPPLRR